MILLPTLAASSTEANGSIALQHTDIMIVDIVREKVVALCMRQSIRAELTEKNEKLN